MIKARIADELGMPTGKQKLQVGVSILFLPCCMHARNGVWLCGCIVMLEPELLHERVW